ncbi:MAG TPA: hypothetical protein VEM13_06015 [Gemmatimonadales bacterium]|nr:hypothetical protein [Gemmatimonadales bacterium]
MDTGQQALVFFYGVFWATVIGATVPYRGFATALALVASDLDKRRKCRRRLLVAFVLLNVLPAALLYVLYSYVVPNCASGRAIVAAGVASLSVFGVHRVFHAIVCSKETWPAFYTAAEIKEYHLDTEDKSGSTWWAHAVPGVAYLVGMPLIARVLL